MRLILISLDAVSQPDADRLFSLPALSALKENGVFCQNVQTVYPTITYPIHTSILTGCYPDKHGIHHNQPFQPSTPPKLRKWYWEIGDIRVKTLHQACHEAGGDTASVLWPVTGKNPYTRRNFPEVLPLPGESPVIKMLRYASPLWLLKTELLHGKKRKSIRQPDLDDYATVLCKDILSSRKAPDFLTLHLVDCDAMRHENGTHSPQAYDAMQRMDKHIQEILDTLKASNRLDDTIICIVSDHGHRDAPHGVFLDAKLESLGVGRAQSLGMGAYIFSEDLAHAKTVLTSHQQEWHIAHIYSDEELRALHAPANVHLAVEAEDGCCFIDEAEVTRGEHGFSVAYPEAQTFLLLSGGPFQKGCTLPQARVVDIAPTLAQAMGWHMPDTDGQPLKSAFLKP